MPRDASEQPQTSVYETEIVNQALEKALIEREQLKDARREAGAAFNEIDDRVKAMIEGLELGDEAPVRVGNFVIERKLSPARSVSFDTEARKRISIKTIA